MTDRNISTLPAQTPVTGDTVVGTKGGAAVQFPAGPTFSQLAAPEASTGLGTQSSGPGSVPRTVYQVADESANIRSKGGVVNGLTNDVTAATNAVLSFGRVTIDRGVSLLRQWKLPSGGVVDGGGELIQDTADQHTVYAGSATETNPANFDLRPTVRGMKFGPMPVATSDDFGAMAFIAARGGGVDASDFYNTENATIVGAPDTLYGTAEGSTDVAITNSVFRFVRRYVVQIIQASFTRVIGIAAHNNGDNTYSNSGVDTGPNNGGNNCGIRIAGNGRGNMVGLSSIRDKAIGASFQLGQEHALICGVYFENMLQEAVSATTGSGAGRASHVLSGILVRDAGAVGVSLRNMNHVYFSGLVDGTGKTAAAAQKQGIDLFPQVASDEVWEILFSGGSGVVPAVGAAITQGAVSAVLVSVWATNAYAATAAAAAMPSSGRILVKTRTGGLFVAGALTGIGATATLSARCLDGRHRIDAIVTGSGSSGVRAGSNKNLLTLVVDNPLTGPAADVSGSNNIVMIQAADGLSNGGTAVDVSGSNNTIYINESSGRVTGLQVTGSNNTIYGNIAGNVSITGTNSTLVGRCAGRCDISVAGNGTTIVGEVVGTFADASTGGNYRAMKGGMTRGSSTVTTDASGVVTVAHGLKTTASPATFASAFFCSVTSATPLLCVTKANNATANSKVTFYTFSAGVPTPLVSQSVSFDWEAQL